MIGLVQIKSRRLLDQRPHQNAGEPRRQIGIDVVQDWPQRAEQAIDLFPLLLGRQVRNWLTRAITGSPKAEVSHFSRMVLSELGPSCWTRRTSRCVIGNALRFGVEAVPIRLRLFRFAPIEGSQAANEELPFAQRRVAGKVAKQLQRPALSLA